MVSSSVAGGAIEGCPLGFEPSMLRKEEASLMGVALTLSWVIWKMHRELGRWGVKQEDKEPQSPLPNHHQALE